MNVFFDYTLFNKCVRVIDSCVTLKQLQGASRYCMFALKYMPYFLVDHLLNECKKQREKILQTELNQRYEAML